MAQYNTKMIFAVLDVSLIKGLNVGETDKLENFRVHLFVCFSVCSQHNSEKNDPKVFKLGTRNDLGINTRSNMLLRLKGQNVGVCNK